MREPTQMIPTTVTTRSQARLILIGTALLLTIGMGIRQSFGLFLTPILSENFIRGPNWRTEVNRSILEADVRDLMDCRDLHR